MLGLPLFYVRYYRYVDGVRVLEKQGFYDAETAFIFWALLPADDSPLLYKRICY